MESLAPLAPDAPVLTVTHLRAAFGRQVVLDDVSLSLHRAQIGVVLGGSGCGKSTLLRHCVGLLAPDAGEVRVFGQSLATASEPQMVAIRRRTGVLFQSGALLGDLTVRENVMLPMRMLTGWPGPLCRDVANTKLAWLGLRDAAHARPDQLSGGMRKRAALARALALEPDLLLCDEPSAGLDPVTAAELDALLLRTRDTFGTSMLVVTHELASIGALADHVVMLEAGHVLAEGPLAVVRQRSEPSIAGFFNRMPRSNHAGTAVGAESLFHALGGSV